MRRSNARPDRRITDSTLPDTPLPPGALGSGLLTDEVALEVSPDRGVYLGVYTEEATVVVIGTGFDVRRDPLGTSVEVRHGRGACHMRRRRGG